MFPSSCQVRVFCPHPEMTVVILSDSGEGGSITNSIEYILLPLARQFKVNPHLATWIEHYPGHDAETEFSQIVPIINGNRVKVSWVPLIKADVEKLCGTALSEI